MAGGAAVAPEAEAPPPLHTSKEEMARLAKLGLKEYPIKGTHLCLVGMIDEKKAPPTVEQRVEMARRLNEVGPRLPRYVKHLHNEKKPATSVAAILEVAANVTNGEEMARQKAKEEAAKEAAAEKAGPKRRTKKIDVAPEKPAPAKAEKAAKKKTSAEKANGEKKEKGGGIGGIIRKMLADKKGTEEILAAVKKDFPKARTSPASIAWYRSEMRGEGKLPKA